MEFIPCLNSDRLLGRPLDNWDNNALKALLSPSKCNLFSESTRILALSEWDTP